MALLWKDQLSVGNDLIDGDHKYLIEVINKAEVAIKAQNSVQLTGVLDELGRYGASHFDREELVAKAVGYPKSDQLHVSHERLKTELQRVKEEFGESWTQETGAAFTQFLRDWLVEHVIKEDMLMKPWMTKHSPRFDPR